SGRACRFPRRAAAGDRARACRPAGRSAAAWCADRSLRDRRSATGHAERRRMMLGAVIAVDAGTLVGFDQLEPVLVERVQRSVVAVDVVENAELQGHSCNSRLCRAMLNQSFGRVTLKPSFATSDRPGG